jgi:hypothetical protein
MDNFLIATRFYRCHSNHNVYTKCYLSKSGKRKRRDISPVAYEQDTPSSKPKEEKKKLDFNEDTEQAAPKKTNFLNFPYSDSYEELEKEEVSVDENIEFSMEQAPKTEMFTSLEKGGTSSSKKKQNRSKKIKKLKEKIAQQEVLERVIKARYKTLSKNFIETSAVVEILALESINEKKKKKRIIKDNHKLWRLAKHLKKKVRLLRLQAMPLRPQPQAHVDLETLENAAIHLNDPEATNNSTTIPELAQYAKASEDQP